MHPYTDYECLYEVIFGSPFVGQGNCIKINLSLYSPLNPHPNPSPSGRGAFKCARAACCEGKNRD